MQECQMGVTFVYAVSSRCVAKESLGLGLGVELFLMTLGAVSQMNIDMLMLSTSVVHAPISTTAHRATNTEHLARLRRCL